MSPATSRRGTDTTGPAHPGRRTCSTGWGGRTRDRPVRAGAAGGDPRTAPCPVDRRARSRPGPPRRGRGHELRGRRGLAHDVRGARAGADPRPRRGRVAASWSDRPIVAAFPALVWIITLVAVDLGPGGDMPVPIGLRGLALLAVGGLIPLWIAFFGRSAGAADTHRR